MTPLTTKAAEIRAGLVADWRKAMEGVTPGPWLMKDFDTVLSVSTTDGSAPLIADLIEQGDAEGPGYWGSEYQIGQWIARCSPAGIASLLALIESLIKENAALSNGVSEIADQQQLIEQQTAEPRYHSQSDAHCKQQAAELADEKGARETAERGGELILADLEQARAELAEARAENEKLVELTKFWIDDSIAAHRAHTTAESERDSWRRVCERLETEKQALKSERDELLREKERHWGGIRECPQEPSGAGAIRTKHDLDYFDGHDADGDDEGSWEPWFDQFVTALGAYINCRDEQVTVRAAGDVFNVADAVILKAVEEHYWLFASGPSDDPTKQIIEMGGE